MVFADWDRIAKVFLEGGRFSTMPFDACLYDHSCRSGSGVSDRGKVIVFERLIGRWMHCHRFSEALAGYPTPQPC